MMLTAEDVSNTCTVDITFHDEPWGRLEPATAADYSGFPLLRVAVANAGEADVAENDARPILGGYRSGEYANH